jgi:hypothetical protein
MGELDRVADQVDQHLSNPAGIAVKPAPGVRRVAQDQRKPLCSRVRRTCRPLPSTVASKSNGPSSMGIRPASIFERSRMSLMSVSNECALDRAIAASSR